jgi:hypothetical protein
VVQLFNAISKHQKEVREAKGLEPKAKKENDLNSLSKERFLEMLKQGQ